MIFIILIYIIHLIRWLDGRVVKAAAFKSLEHSITRSNPTVGSKFQKPLGLSSCVLGLGHLNTTGPDLVEGQLRYD